MVGPSLSTPNTSAIKFLCSYGGKILPRHPDGKLRYHGGITRVLAVDRSISFSELLVKLGELCGSPVSLRCQHPTEDLDALVSITSDEDLANLIDEYDRCSSPLKIRAFLSPPRSATQISPPPSSTDSPRSVFQSSGGGGGCGLRYRDDRCVHQKLRRTATAPPVVLPVRYEKPKFPPPRYPYSSSHHQQGNPSQIYVTSSHWQQ